ncbi:hypothetical protein MLD38_039231 [Melastoma candidum]|uniref:Uncharacterized protein n=1 Tax=Melastoma candidum TaxID=119954 RepID=A0ACB9L2M1_9MYRT|nr:hypothetical protein MLD38_039231 [Melastoma candidum]
MGRTPCCPKVGLHRGPWSFKEDALLTRYIEKHGEGNWRNLPKKAGLLRCGKSCRLRWMNYLRPDIKRGNITPDEDDLIMRLHSLLGNRWSLIAGRLPGRTDNEIKNHWNSHLCKKLKNRAGETGRAPKSPSVGPDKPRIKIHHPKAIRVSPYSVIPRTDSLDNLLSGTPSPTNQRDELGPSNINIDRNAVDGVAGGVVAPSYGNDHDGFFIPIEEWDNDDMKTLDKLFEEYEKLKRPGDAGQMESFLDSFLLI